MIETTWLIEIYELRLDLSLLNNMKCFHRYLITVYLYFYLLLCGVLNIWVDGDSLLQTGIYPLYHWRLCNNGDQDPVHKDASIAKIYTQNKCSYADQSPVSCENRKIAKVNCTQANVMLYMPSMVGYHNKSMPSKPSNTATIAINRHNVVPILQQIFTEFDDNTALRRINITYPSKLHKIIIVQLDDLLTTRLWLQIADESHPWNLTDSLHITIERVHHIQEGYLTWLSDIQYPTEELCNTRALAVCTQTSIHPGWGSVISSVVEFHYRTRFSPIAMYISISNIPQDSAQFIAGINCPDEVNKWECAFLPVFNCTLPDFITKCHEHNCVQDIYFQMLSNSSKNAQIVYENKDVELLHHIGATQASPPTPRNAELWAKADLPKPTYRLSPKNTTKIRDTHGVHYGLQLNNFLFRFNSFYRSLIDLTFRSLETRDNIRLSDFGTKEFCVAAHIRRGDRINYEKNITQHCKENPNDNDRGCGAEVPFANVDIPLVIKHAEQMLTGPSRHLFVTTDDPKWLEEQVELLDPKVKQRWKIHSIPWEHAYAASYSSATPEEKHKTYYHMRSQAGTQSGVHFFASLKLMQSCDGFVGHFGSAVSWMIHNMMCAQHSIYQGVCPPTHDFHDHGL